MLLIFAVTTRLELATSGVTGRHSNQLNYATIFLPSKTGVQPPATAGLFCKGGANIYFLFFSAIQKVNLF